MATDSYFCLGVSWLSGIFAWSVKHSSSMTTLVISVGTCILSVMLKVATSVELQVSLLAPQSWWNLYLA